MSEEKLSQKWCIVTLLEDIKEGCSFHMSKWPLHVTIAGVHDAPWDKSMVSEFEQILKDVSPITLEGTERATLGTTKVVLIDKSNDLITLHSLIIDFLEDNGTVFNNPEWQKKGYIPHSTVQRQSSVAVDEKLVIDNIALVDMFPNQDGSMRKITKLFKLT